MIGGRNGDLPLKIGDHFTNATIYKHRKYPDDYDKEPEMEYSESVNLRIIAISAYGKDLELLGEGTTGYITVEGDDSSMRRLPTLIPETIYTKKDYWTLENWLPEGLLTPYFRDKENPMRTCVVCRQLKSDGEFSISDTEDKPESGYQFGTCNDCLAKIDAETEDYPLAWMFSIEIEKGNRNND